MGDERGSWEAYKDGQLVGSDSFEASSNSGDHMFEIWIDGGFDELRFTADNGSSDRRGGDSSDYHVEEIWFGQPTLHESFVYTLADGDWSMDDATLKIEVKDTAPDAHDDMDMVLEGGVTEGNVITGADPDTDPNMLQADDQSQDLPNVVCEVEHNGQTYVIPEGGSVDIPTALGGVLHINSDGSYEYTAPSAVHHGTILVDNANMPSFVTISGYDKNGNPATVTTTADGLGVESGSDNGSGGRYDEINYVDNSLLDEFLGDSDGSEGLTFALADGIAVDSATVQISKLFPNEGRRRQRTRPVGNLQRWRAGRQRHVRSERCIRRSDPVDLRLWSVRRDPLHRPARHKRRRGSVRAAPIPAITSSNPSSSASRPCLWTSSPIR